MQNQYNSRNPAVKRLMQEARELQHPTHMYHAQPLDDNLFEWHFTVRGADDSDFAGGLYHGRIMLPSEYPMKPPSIMLLTPNGRFQTNNKICLSISGYHPETWQPSWSIRTALLAIIGFMPTPGEGAIGAIDYTKEERQQLAQKSLQWTCSSCNIKNSDILILKEDDEMTRERDAQETKELVPQMLFKGENDVKVEASAANQSISERQDNPSQEPVLRQRVASTPNPNVETLPELQHQPANENWFYSMFLNILILLLIVAIFTLIARRVSLPPLTSNVISETLANSQDKPMHQSNRPIIPPPGGQQ